MTWISRFFLYLLHPMIMPTLGVLLINAYSPIQIPEEYYYLFVGIVFAGTYILPALLVILMMLFGMVQSIELPNRQERSWPLLFSALAVYSTERILEHLYTPVDILHFLQGITLSLAIGFFVNQVIKASVHVAGMGGLIGGVLGISVLSQINLFYLLGPLLLLAGFLGTTRIHLKAHQPSEVYIGFLVGFVPVFTVMIL
ncbi:hypothetical protein HZ996_02205 [Cryomorphaceae bacterium]|nr:hypothetical protein HZ996_02205 [Cryomorphaceae bacterium]